MRIVKNRRFVDDSGVTAVVVALLSVVLISFLAFSIDLGIAYTNKRDLQKGADAASLAAAIEIVKNTKPTAKCSHIAGDFSTGELASVTTTAKTIARENQFWDSEMESIGVSCSTDGKRVEVKYVNRGTTPGIFAPLLGISSLNATREATADIFVRTSATGLRPYFLCETDLERITDPNTSLPVVEVMFPNPDAAACPQLNGNWYTTNCPQTGNNGTLAEDTEFGCRRPIGVLTPTSPPTPWPTIPAPSPSSSPLTDEIIARCQDATSGNPQDDPHTCLIANPGNVASNNVENAWKELLKLDSIVLPVFPKSWASFAEANVSACKTGGNNGCYPVSTLVGVKVCAYKWGNNRFSTRDDDHEPCVTEPKISNIKDNVNRLWLQWTSTPVSGPVASDAGDDCGLGDPSCDFGARGTRLIK
jgi:hypothetical protein